ncbi:hypothetical protein K438DRAFT_1957407 [Mycena galopus ATCC 62051]|nr:hypothetical protein K438DRAFT_1957407 [Mycena galopus ATCC 62051]
MISGETAHPREAHTICDFPPELLARIVKTLGHFDILRAGMVCKFWNAVVREDPEIAELLHKRICRSISHPSDFCGETALGEPVVVHPALQFMSYCMGEQIETAAILRPAKETDAHPDSSQRFPIIDLGIAHDFATRPTVTQMFIKPKKEFTDPGMGGPFCARVTNTRGVTVLDVLQAIVRERYEGLEAVRKGLRVHAVVVLGLQRSEDEFYSPKAGL